MPFCRPLPLRAGIVPDQPAADTGKHRSQLAVYNEWLPGMKKDRTVLLILLSVLMVLLLATILLMLHLERSSSMNSSARPERKIMQWERDQSMDTVLALIRNGSLAEAEELLISAINQTSEREDVWMLLGTVQFRRNKFQAAEKSFQRLLKLQPDNAAAYNNLGETLAKQQKILESMQAFDEAVKLAPNNSEILLNAANLHAKMADKVKAVELLRRALQNGSSFEDIVKYKDLVRILEETDVQNMLKNINRKQP
jgi:Tfp pilus assembly protein PilF